jgi:Xaa-Pro aminopeptidase
MVILNSHIARRIEALRGLLKDASVDTGWILKPENRRYLSGFSAEDSQFDESSGSLLIGAESLLLLTDSRYREQAAREAGDFRVEVAKGAFPGLFSRAVTDMGSRRVGFEKNYLSWGMHTRVTEELKRGNCPAELVPLDGAVEGLRQVKDPAELDALAASARMISEILNSLISWIEPGMTERAIAWRLTELVYESGVEGPAFPPIVASGPNSSLPHASPTNRRVGKGEPLTLDVGVRFRGYCSDITRTIFLGDPADEFKTVYSVVRKAQHAALDVLMAGAVASDVDRVARELIEEAGFGDCFGHGLGHGVGLAVHESPRLNSRDSTVLEPGMVVTVEPGIYIPGKGGVRLEETVVVDTGGPGILTCCDHFYDW